MLVNTLMQMVSVVIHRLIGDNSDDAAHLEIVTLPKFIVSSLISNLYFLSDLTGQFFVGAEKRVDSSYY